MVKLRTDRAPAFFGEHEWKTTDSVVEVTEDEAHQLLGIPDAAFIEVQTKESPKAKTQVTEPDPDAVPAPKGK